jgi:hypothetical protein
VYTCLSTPDACDTPEQLVRLAEVSVPAFPGNQRALGAALYRAGRYRAALAQFEKSTKVIVLPWDDFFLAMIHHRLGQTKAARAHLAGAIATLENANADWVNWAFWRALREEAETLLGVGKEVPARTPTSHGGRPPR